LELTYRDCHIALVDGTQHRRLQLVRAAPLARRSCRVDVELIQRASLVDIAPLSDLSLYFVKALLPLGSDEPYARASRTPPQARCGA
jgi:hypothetical protein